MVSVTQSKNREDGRQTFTSWVKHSRSRGYTMTHALEELTDKSLEWGGDIIDISFKH